MTPLEEAAQRFVDAFEPVFHSDWNYTRSHGLGAGDPPAGGKLRAIFGEETDATGEGATFLAHKLSPSELEAQNWGNYEILLERYHALCSALGRKPFV